MPWQSEWEGSLQPLDSPHGRGTSQSVRYEKIQKAPPRKPCLQGITHRQHRACAGSVLQTCQRACHPPLWASRYLSTVGITTASFSNTGAHALCPQGPHWVGVSENVYNPHTTVPASSISYAGSQCPELSGRQNVLSLRATTEPPVSMKWDESPPMARWLLAL